MPITRSGGLLFSCLFLVLAGAWAAEPLTPPAPELPAGAAWLNSTPLTLAGARGKKVVLLAFLNTANINSLRALGFLKTLESRYSPQGLLIIGVHTPDFGFQKDPRVVRASLARLKIAFPVVLDGERRLWKAYSVAGWPSFYLIDHKGLLMSEKLGEAGYAGLEEDLRDELDKLPRYEVPAIPAPVDEPSTSDCGTMTPEIQLGSRRSAPPVPLTVQANRLVFRDGVGDATWGYAGDWAHEPEHLRLTKGNKTRQSFLSALYRGVRAYALLGSGPKPVRVMIRQDDEWLHRADAGKDVKFDEDLHSYVEVSETRVYSLVKNPNDYQHELTLMPLQADALVYDFSFSDQCVAPFAP